MARPVPLLGRLSALPGCGLPHEGSAFLPFPGGPLSPWPLGSRRSPCPSEQAAVKHTHELTPEQDSYRGLQRGEVSAVHAETLCPAEAGSPLATGPASPVTLSPGVAFTWAQVGGGPAFLLSSGGHGSGPGPPGRQPIQRPHTAGRWACLPLWRRGQFRGGQLPTPSRRVCQALPAPGSGPHTRLGSEARAGLLIPVADCPEPASPAACKERPGPGSPLQCAGISCLPSSHPGLPWCPRGWPGSALSPQAEGQCQAVRKGESGIQVSRPAARSKEGPA